MNRFRRSAVSEAMRAKASPLPWLIASLLLLPTTGARAQLRLKLDGPPPMPLLTPHNSSADVEFFRISQPDVNFFGERHGRAVTEGGHFSTTNGYSELLTFRNNGQLHGTLSENKGTEILWQRPDASEPLRFPSSAVRSPTDSGGSPDPDLEREPANRLAQRLCEAAFVGSEFVPMAAVAREVLPAFFPASEADVLVFRDGDELPGTTLSGDLQGPVRWRTVYGQTVDFQTDRIAGIRLAERGAHRAAQANEPISLVELRTGERLQGDLVALDAQQLHLNHLCLGAVTIPREQLSRLFPNSQSVVFARESGRGDWQWMTTDSVTHRVEPCRMENIHWVRLDGAYLLRNAAPPIAAPTSFLPGWQHAIPQNLDRFEFQFRLSPGARIPSNCAVTLFGGDGVTLCVTFSYRMLEYVVVDPGERLQNRWQHVPLTNKLFDLTAPRDFRFLVDTNAGTCQVMINGVSALRLGKNARDRLTKTDYCIRLQPFANPKSVFFSNLQVLPWNGDAPAASATDPPSTLLRNGDTVPAAPRGLQEGRWTLESDLGPMQLPADKILMADFGGSTSSQPAAGRIRLIDGSILNLDTAQWTGDGLNAHHAVLGNIHVPLSAVAEIVVAPTPLHAPIAPAAEVPVDQNVIQRKLEIIIK